MPYKVVKLPSKTKPYGVKNLTTGKIVGRSKTKELAAASARARYAAIGRKDGR
jgi:hypothetical protein